MLLRLLCCCTIVHGMRRIAASVAISLLGALFAAGPASASGLYAVNLNDGSVSQYGVAADGALSPLSPAVVPAGPGHSVGIAITPDGRSAYVTNLGGSVSQYDIGPGGALTPKSPATVSTPPGAEGVAVSPDGKSVYVGTGANAVAQFDVGSGGTLVPKAPPTVPNGGAPHYLAVSPDGKSVYVVDEGNEMVSQYDVGAGGVLTPKSPATVPVGESPEGVAVSPDGKSLYVANYGSGDVSQFDIGPGGLLAPKSPATVAAGEGPTGIGISPDGRSAYVANDTDEVVSQYDIGPGGSLTPKAPPTVFSGFGPDWIAVSPSGRSVYVSLFGSGTSGGGVSQYDAGAGGALFAKSPAFLPAGNGPIGVAITPDQPPAASLTVPADRVRPGVPIALNASASSDPDGSIARYDWSFGDGHSAPNGGAAPMHAYAKPGLYPATVTVTDNEGCSTALLFTGQTAFCSGSSSASETQPVKVAYPAVRVRCPTKARPKGCKFKLQAVTKKRKGKAESAVAKSRAKAGHSTVVPLKPKAKFRSKLATADSVLVKKTVTIDGAGKTSYRKLKIVG
jgi:YVTN family beta-propeller protein